MIVNNNKHEATLKENTSIATAHLDDIVQLNHPDTNIEQMSISHRPHDKEMATLEATEDRTAHKSKLASDSAINSQQRSNSRRA